MTGLYLALGAVAVFGLLIWLGFRAARGEGREAERADAAGEGLEQARQANEIDENVVRLGDADLDKRLRAIRGERL